MLILSIVIYAVAVLLIAPYGNFPLNDDWYFSVPAQLFAQMNQYHAIDGTAVWAFPQIILGGIFTKIFGFSHVSLRIFGIFSLIALAALADSFMRKSNTSKQTRGIALFSFLFFVPTFVNSVSFMTDLPFLVLWVASCTLWAEAFNKSTLKNIALATLVTLICTSQRQFGILLAPMTFTYALILGRGRFNKATLCFGLSFVAQVCFFAAITFYWNNVLKIPVYTLIPSADFTRITHSIFKSLSYIGLATSPIILLGIPFLYRNLIVSKGLKVCAFGIAVVLTLLTRQHILAGQRMPYFENTFSKYGMFAYGDLIGGPRSPLIHPNMGIALTLFSTFFAFLLLIQVCIWIQSISTQKLKSPESFLFVATLGYLLGISILLKSCWDRYLFPGFFAFIVILAIKTETTNMLFKRAATLLTGIFMVCAVCVGQDFISWSNARWDAANWLLTQGYSVKQIEGGHEWNALLIEKTESGIYSPASSPKEVKICFASPEDQGVLKSFEYKSWISRGTIVAKKIIP